MLCLARRAVLASLWFASPALAEVTAVAEAVDPAEEEPLVVTGTRTENRLADTPVATEVIDRAAIDRSGARTLADVLQTRSGVSVDRSFRGAGVSLIGLDPRYTLVLVDGERPAGRVDGVFDAERIPVEQIERVEIVRGAASALYGADAIGGVINIITRRPSGRPTGEARVSAGSDESVDLAGDVGGGLGPVQARLSGGWHHATAYDLNPDDAATDGSEIGDGQGRLELAIRPSKRWRVDTHGSYGLRDRDGIDASPTGAVLDRKQSTETYGGGARLDYKGEGGLRFGVRASADHLREQYRLDQRGADALDRYEDTRITQARAEAQLDWTLASWHRLTVGADGRSEAASSPRLADGEGSRLRGAVFAQDQWTLSAADPYLVVVGGVRVDGYVDSETVVTPRLALRYDPHPTVALRAAAGLGHREPEFKERLLRFENPAVGYVVEGNPELRAERAQNVQIGAEWRPLSALELSLSGFYAVIDDLIVFELDPSSGGVGEPDRYRYANVATAYTRGLDAAASARLDGYRLGVSYQLADTLDEAQDRPLEGRALHRVAAEAGTRHDATGLGADVQAAFVGERSFYPAEGVTVVAEPYLDLRARVEWSPSAHLTVFALGENLLDAGETLYLPLRPRRFSAGVIGRL